MVLLLLLDAFRPDYLAYAPFLTGLARQSWTGAYQETFGFTPRDSYFRGATPAESGYTHMFRFDPVASPFFAARHFPPEGAISAELRWRLRSKLHDLAGKSTSSFAASYLHSFEIPFRLLPCFDLAEKTPPWQRAAGRTSVFEELDRQGRRWEYLAWPALSELGAGNDSQVVELALERITTDTEFAFVQFSELDAAGHEHGPGSREVVECIRRLDELTGRLLTGLQERATAVQTVVFGDHGMVNVVRCCDVERLIKSTGLDAPFDFTYFLDSTCARFWYRHPEARRRVHEALEGCDGGEWLDSGALARYGMTSIDRANGEDYFLAHPGVLLVPNFFHSSGRPPKGMHGYAPECEDNHGLFLVAGPQRGLHREVGTVLPGRFHSVLRSLLFNEGTLSDLLPAVEPREGGAEACAMQGVVETGLSAILEKIRSGLGPEDCVVVTGGFGRGEGTMAKENGRYRPMNDYDVIVAGPDPEPAIDWKPTARVLADQLGLPYVDLSWRHKSLMETPPRTLFFFDFLHGSRVIHGRRDLLNASNRFAAAEVRAEEGLICILNRLMGLFIGLRPECLPPAALDEADREFLWIQHSKLGIALADRRLLEWQAYDTSYRVRLRRFRELGSAAGLSPAALELLCGCYTWKLSAHAALRSERHLLVHRRRDERRLPARSEDTPDQTVSIAQTRAGRERPDDG
ncbi:MAG: alkaline phosphatase family protein [Acidobacteria bacterium]|nr:alkaline phosphatase family protein [Acidobacteriota bacterium]